VVEYLCTGDTSPSKKKEAEAMSTVDVVFKHGIVQYLSLKCALSLTDCLTVPYFILHKNTILLQEAPVFDSDCGSHQTENNNIARCPLCLTRLSTADHHSSAAATPICEACEVEAFLIFSHGLALSGAAVTAKSKIELIEMLVPEGHKCLFHGCLSPIGSSSTDSSTICCTCGGCSLMIAPQGGHQVFVEPKGISQLLRKCFTELDDAALEYARENLLSGFRFFRYVNQKQEENVVVPIVIAVVLLILSRYRK
jgi:hypothetical protein